MKNVKPGMKVENEFDYKKDVVVVQKLILKLILHILILNIFEIHMSLLDEGRVHQLT